MAVKKLYLDKRTLKNPSGGGSSEANLQNLLDLKEYIQDVVDDNTTDFTSINVDTINESTAAHGVIVDGATIKDGKILVVDGTAAAPSISFVNDTNTGFYLLGADNLAFTAGGSIQGYLAPTQLLLAVGVSLATDTIAETTTNVGVTVDSVLLKDGGVSNAGATAFAGFYFDAAANNITAGTGGAISVANYLTTINTDAGGDAFTLANGTQIGQLKKILLVADGGGDGVVTPATAFAGGATTATFNDAADYLILMWNGSAWRVLENSGVTVA